VIRSLGDLPEDKRTAVRNNAGGHVNHSMFWQLMAPAGKGGGGSPSGDVAKAIEKSFGTFDHFKEEFAKAGMGRFGSGWAWLVVQGDGSVSICSTPNQDNPLMGKTVAGCEGTPARLLPEVPEQAGGLPRGVVERRQLAEGGGAVRQGAALTPRRPRIRAHSRSR
jgi:superoxide dismutase